MENTETTETPVKKEKKIKTNCKTDCKPNNPASSGGAFYFMGVIGAAIFFISQAYGFWMGVLAFLKALVWPVFFVLEGFKHFMM